MNDREYDALPGIRRSDLWHMKPTPMHFRWHMDNPEESTPALIFGQAAHKYILEPETFFDEFEVIPKVDRRKKEGKQVIQAFELLNSGKTFVTADEMQTIMTMREQLLRNDDIRELLEDPGNKYEQAFSWVDPKTGQTCKVKADIITDTGLIIDYKTTSSCAGTEFERSCRKYGYDFQSGMYVEGIDLCTMERHEFAFIAQEKTPPYAARIYYCDSSFIAQGQRKFHDLLEQYDECTRTGNWYGYDTEELYEDNYD